MSMGSLSRLAFAAALLVAAPVLLAQPRPAGAPPGRPLGLGPLPGPEGAPPRERFFFIARELQAVDEKVNLLMQMGKADAAIEELSRVMAIEVPKGHPVYEVKAHLIARLASISAALGRRKPALDTIQRLLADVPPGSPAEAEAWLAAGSVYKTLGMPEDALKAFDRSIELSQNLARSGRRPGPPQGAGGRPPGPAFTSIP